MRRSFVAIVGAAGALIAAAGIASDRAAAAANVSITKSAPSSAAVGEQFAYVLVLRNGGDKPANEVTVSDDLPAEVEFKAATSPCTATDSKVECVLGKVPVNAETTITIDVLPKSPGSVVNTAKVTFNADKTATASATTDVSNRPIVTFSSDAASTANEGQTTTYSFAVSDADSGDSFGVASSYPRCGPSGALVAGSLQTTASGGSFQCKFTDGDASSVVAVKVIDSHGVASNEATISVAVANLAPSVALGGADTAHEGETKTYLFAVSDPGTDTFGVASAYPKCGANGTVVGSPQTTGSGGSFQCKFTVGGTTSVVAITVIDSDGAASNEATISVAVANVAPVETQADLAVTKTDSADPIPVGSVLTYEITVTNNGPATAAGVRIVDPLPSGLTPISVTTSQGTCSGSAAVTCSFGSLQASARVTVEISVRPAAAGSLVNTVAVTSTSPDAVSTNDTATVDTTVQAPVGVQTTTTQTTTTQTTTTQTTTMQTTTMQTTTTVQAPGTQAPDVLPPHEVAKLQLRRAPTALQLSWQLPADTDLAGVVITRTTSGSPTKLTLYRGRGTAFTDRRVRAGSRYWYRVRTYDAGGNTSAGVVVSGAPRLLALFAPPPNARVVSPPLLRWLPAKGASYYNLQLLRNGQKVLSAWPRSPMLQLRSSWRFKERVYQLAPGAYRWYVWPAYGQRGLGRYGSLLGQSAFSVVRATS